MTKRLFFLFAFTLVSSLTFAQRWAYVDTEYILSRLPKYREAQSQLDNMSREWQKEIDEQLKVYNEMQIALENEKSLLTNDLIEERKQEINDKLAQIEKLQQQRFGPEGDLITQRKQLVKPIQDQVFNAVQSIAAKKRLDAIFDKSSDLIMLYYNKKIDVSDEVLEQIKKM